MAERRLAERNAKIAAMLESGEGLKNFYRFISQNEYINLHDACQIVIERPDATVCNTLEEWNAMGRRVIKGRKSIAYYDHDGYKQFVFDANDTYGDERYQRPILPIKHLLIGLDELNGTNVYEDSRSDYRKIHNGVYTYLEKQNELTGDEQYDRLLAEGIGYSLYCKTGFPKTQNIRLHGLPYSYRENAAFVKELYIRSELLAEEIEEAYQSKQSEVEVIDDIDEETVSDEPIVQSEPAEQTGAQGQPEQGVERADEIRASEQESENLAPEQGATVSPMYRRYLEAQQLNVKAIVLLRVGDFYEVMGENARIVAEEVGLTLTSRDVGLSECVPMCGFPYFASDAYIEKILETHGVILAEDGKEPRYILSHTEALEQGEKEETAHGEEAEELAELFGEEAEQTSPVRKPILVEIDDEPNPFDDEQSEEEETEGDEFADDGAFFEEESETEKPAPKKDEKGIQDRKRKQKPQLSMFDLIEPKSEREQLIERALQYGSGVQYGKYRIFDKYNENPTSKAFADFVKHEYGIGGHGSTNGDDEWHDGKGIRISHDGTAGKLEVLLKWQDVAFRIADLIDDDNYLTEQEKAEYVKYRAEQNRKKELRAEEERQKRELIEQVIVKEPPARKQRILDEYSQTTKIVDFAVFLCDEYGTATEATSQYHARYDKNGVWMAKYDRVGNTELRIYLSWEQFAEKVCDVIEREHLFAPEDAAYNQSFAERMVKQGTQNTEDGQYSFYFGTFEKDESYVRTHCEEIKEALLSREEVKTVGSDEWYIRAEFYKEYCEKLKGTEEARREHDARIEAIAARIVEEGTRNTTEGNWVTFFDELSRDENFAKANAEEIAAVLELRKEVSDVELTPDAFDTNFYLDYCPNYIPQAGEDGYEESEPSNSEQGENTDLTAVFDQTDLGGAKTRFKNNVAAIRLINFLDERGAMATDSEKKTLSQFVGWGGLSQAFDEKNESWKKEYAELKTLLSAEDYEQARSSTLNAYYTPKEVIGGIYAALQRFGVKANNRILEPAMGTGNFFGYMPKEIAEGSRLYGVELDNVTGRIAAKLYPQAIVQIKGFEDTSFPNDKFDLVVGNVPFGGYGVADSDYNRYNFKVHDYFLAKSVDKVRPGGIVAIITSKGTMDKLNPSARKYVAERAELLGAVRLPNNAFKQTAGTEAVADILFFRKREEKINDLSKEEWLETGKTAEGYEINNYFLAHPKMILGTLAEEHGLYGGIDTTVKPDGRDLNDALAEAIQHLPQGFYNNPETPPEQEREAEVDYNVKPFCYKADRGKLYQRVGDEMVEQAIPKTPKDAYQRICGMIGLRESLHHILDIQIAGCSDEVLTREQWTLNSRYDLFIKKYGNLNSQTNSKLFKDDGDSALLFACEDVDEQTKTVTKADIFSKRTIRPYVVPTSTDDPFEALQISKNERGKVDIAYIEELTGKDYETVVTELGNAVFRDPEQVKAEDQYSGFVTAEEYLSGQVVTKLERARALAAEHPEYQKNVAALEAVQELLIERIGKDLEMLKTRRPADPEAFEISVNGKIYTDRKEGGKALTDALYASKVGTPVAEYCGFVISMNPMSFLATEREITLAGEGQYVITIGDSASGNLTRLDNFLNDLPEREKRLKSKLEQLKSDLVIAKEQAGKPFEQAERLKELLSEQAQLNAELNLNQREDAIVDDEDEEEDETAYRALPDMQRQNREVNIIDEEDKVAAMQVDLLPDYTVTQEDMHAYGYTWDGMLPVSRRTAYRLWAMGLGVHKLAPDDTDMPVEQYGDLNPHERVYYGIEKPTWNNYLKDEKSLPYLYARKEFCDAASKVANEELSPVDERFMIDFSETNFRERMALERYLANKGRPDPNVLPGYVPELLDEFSARMWSDVLHEYGWTESDMPRALAEHLEEPALQKAAKELLSRETERKDGSPLYEENVGMTNSVKEIDYEAEVIKSVNTEFEIYKADVLSRSPEDIFYENYKIHVMTELKEVIEEGVQDGYLEEEHYKALYEERGSILTALYDDFIGDEYASVNSYGETAEFIKNYYEQYHQSAMYADAPLYLKTARYAREHGESEQYHRSHELNAACREEMDKAISENFDGMHLKEGFERELMERYGRERVEYLLATTVKENAWDGRYSRENREWADSIPVSESESERIACCLHSHPAVIDGLIRRIRLNEHEKKPKKEEEDLAESKYLKETARGYKVVSIAQDKNGRNVAVVQRKNDFTVAVGYDTSDGTWAQGVYDFKDEAAANEYREKYYGKDVEPPEKWYEVFVSREALLKTYEKSSLMRMPSANREYADYTYFIYNNRIKESRQLVDMQSDSRELCYKILLSEGEVVHLRNRDGDEVELSAEEFSELINHTADKDYKREEKPRIAVNIPQAAMIKSYEKASLFRAPNGTDFAGYSYYLPNSVLHESVDGSNVAEARLAEDFTVKMRKGEEEVELTAKEFSELVGKTTAEDYKREPTTMDEYREQQAEKEEWKEIAVSEQAVIANYEKSTLLKMPKGKFEGMVYYIPSGMVRRDENGIRLRLPEDFEVHLKDKGADENIDLSPAELESELAGKTDDDYESIYRRPSEEARKKFEQVEKNLRESLPDEMKNKPNWVVVRTRENKETGRLDKFLIDVHTGKFAESNEPETWTDFDAACKYAKEHGGVALAYALDGTDGIACIDLDHCIGEDGKRSALANEVLAKCGKTYIEQSVSGKGIHVFGKTTGADLRSFSKDGDMEYYQDRHFITMTGEGAGYSRLESFDTPEMQSLLEHKLERRTEWKNVGKGEAGLSQMDDRELLEKAFSAKNGDTVRRLYHGEDLRHNHSNSDMSLMNYLAFYSGGNVEQMTRIFATSGLYRPDKPASYYEYTAIKAAKDTPHYTPPKTKSSAPKSANSGNSK